jgi:hypothetical protein
MQRRTGGWTSWSDGDRSDDDRQSEIQGMSGLLDAEDATHTRRGYIFAHLQCRSRPPKTAPKRSWAMSKGANESMVELRLSSWYDGPLNISIYRDHALKDWHVENHTIEIGARVYVRALQQRLHRCARLHMQLQPSGRGAAARHRRRAGRLTSSGESGDNGPGRSRRPIYIDRRTPFVKKARGGSDQSEALPLPPHRSAPGTLLRNPLTITC